MKADRGLQLDKPYITDNQPHHTFHLIFLSVIILFQHLTNIIYHLHPGLHS